MKNVIVKTQDLKKYYKTGNQTVKALDGVDFKDAEQEFCFYHWKIWKW